MKYVHTEILRKKFKRPSMMVGGEYDNWQLSFHPTDIARNVISEPRKFNVIEIPGEHWLIIKYDDKDYGPLRGEIAFTVMGLQHGRWNFVTETKDREAILKLGFDYDRT